MLQKSTSDPVPRAEESVYADFDVFFFGEQVPITFALQRNLAVWSVSSIIDIAAGKAQRA